MATLNCPGSDRIDGMQKLDYVSLTAAIKIRTVAVRDLDYISISKCPVSNDARWVDLLSGIVHVLPSSSVDGSSLSDSRVDIESPNSGTSRSNTMTTSR